jgi:hypothetical protein
VPLLILSAVDAGAVRAYYLSHEWKVQGDPFRNPDSIFFIPYSGPAHKHGPENRRESKAVWNAAPRRL